MIPTPSVRSGKVEIFLIRPLTKTSIYVVVQTYIQLHPQPQLTKFNELVIVHRAVYQLRVVFLSENFLRKSRFLRTRKMSVSLSGQVLEPSSLELLARLVLVLLVSQQQQQQPPNNVRYPGDLLGAGLEMGAPSVGWSSLVTS